MRLRRANSISTFFQSHIKTVDRLVLAMSRTQRAAGLTLINELGCRSISRGPILELG